MIAPDITNNDPLIGRMVEGYQFVKRLGEGTYGVVYLARHPRIKDRLVAIKYIKLGDPKQSKKVEREVDILARLQHPNIVDIYDTYRFDHYQLIVMELVRGGSLRDALAQINGVLELKSSIEIVEQLAFALGYVHDAQILHLDLKPANILLDPTVAGQLTRCVITDFGIAQIVNPTSLMSTNLVGTPRYMSPEHFGFGDNKPDRRSDIYSLGIILYELVTGNVPFQAPQLLELLNEHAYSPVPLPSQALPYIPPMLDGIILKALAKSPEARFQTASEMGSALRELRFGPLLSIRSEPPGRVSGDVLGTIARVNADAMAALDGEQPAKEPTVFNLQVMTPSGDQSSSGFDKPSIIIGRDKDVDLVLDQTTVSRRHAQIDCDRNGNLYVTDLQSANGTYLDGVRLTPQERVPWKRDQYLEIQGYLLQIDGLANQKSSVEPFVFKTDVVVALLDELQNQRQKASVRVSLSPAIIYVEPGKPQYIQVRVAPENTPLARYELRAKPGPGIDERWYTLPAGQVIPSGDSYTFDFIVSTPIAGTIGGKTHEISVEVVADQPGIPSAVQILKVRIVPFTRFSIVLQPSEVSHHRRRHANLMIMNTGNHTESFSVEVQCPDTLQITAQPPRIDIEPGQEADIHLKFKAARDATRLRNRLIYTLTVHSASGAMERANGTYVFRRREKFPVGLLILWVLVMIISTRLFLFGIPLDAQIAEVRTVVETLIQAVRG